MSHLHIPDGILPPWLWITGWLVCALWVSLVCVVGKQRWDLRRKVPLVAMASALMILAMTFEIVPLDYHLSLSVIAGIILGPFLAPLAALISEIFLALLGHGGVTVIGLNTLILSAEMIAGWALFRSLHALAGRLLHERAGLRVAVSGVIACALALALATSLTVSVVALAGPRLAQQRSSDVSASHESEQLSLTTFIAVVFTLGPIGWALESTVTAVALVYLHRLRPGLIAGRTDVTGALTPISQPGSQQGAPPCD
ncbi:MAG: energy-coupling factor ABC transporter permease [Actinomycetia bacterium]|nr:energy-coupling factor ABC transporter permease [Actinomycetes bacterium]